MRIFIFGLLASVAYGKFTADCSTTKCSAGYVCEMSKGYHGGYPECVPSSPHAADCSTMKCSAGYVCEMSKGYHGGYPECVPSSPHAADCSTMKCSAGYVCEMSKGYHSGYPECVPSSPHATDCSTMKCSAGYVCEMSKGYHSGYPECVPSSPHATDCSTMKCSAGYVCEMSKGYHPECVPSSPHATDCSTMKCSAGYVCEMSKGYHSGYPECVPSSPHATDCSTMKCSAGYVCEMSKGYHSGYPECVPSSPHATDCSTMKCGAGYVCEMSKGYHSGYPECVPSSPHATDCSTMKCSAGYVCEMSKGYHSGYPECVPSSPHATDCSTMKCGAGYVCEMSKGYHSGYPECVPSSPHATDCSTMKCSAGYVCEMSKGYHGGYPECVPSSPHATDCSTMKCSAGYVCEMSKGYHGGYPECVPSSPHATDCSTMKCGAGYVCEMSKGYHSGYPECVPSSPHATDCSTMKCAVGYVCEMMNSHHAECVPSVSHNGCKGDSDCKVDEFCRTKSLSSGKCGTEMVCVKRSKEGESCGGFKPSCEYDICLSSLKCITKEDNINLPGRCMKSILSEGDICRMEGILSMDRSSDCPLKTMCEKENVNSMEWMCVSSDVIRCSPSSCKEGEYCYVEENDVKCVAPEFDTKCGLKINDVVLCGAGRTCKKGYSCTGCQQTCRCDVNGKKVCSKDCRPSCERVEEKSECLAEPVSEWNPLECKSFSCYNSVKSPSLEEMRYCCEKTGRYCKEDEKDQFDCRSDPKMWSFAQRKWCCENKEVGCPIAMYDCSVDDASMEIVKNAEGLLQTSVVNVTMWEEKKAAYCCEKFQVGCVVDEDAFDCEWSEKTAAAWSEEQSDWCCSVKGVRCPVTDREEVNEKCQVMRAERTSWDELTRMDCCLSDGVGCATEKFDCFSDSKAMSDWGSDQVEWCCNEENIACSVDCRADANLLSEEDKEGCCKSRGLHCNVTETSGESEEAGPQMEGNNHMTSCRLSFKGSYSKIMENPKRFLRKLRRTIMRVTKESESSNVMIKYVGSLMKDNIVPAKDVREKWGTSIPSSWNTELFEKELSKNREVKTLGHGVSSTKEQQSVGDSGMFVDFEVTDKSAAVLTISVTESGKGSGLLRDNGDGSTLIMEPVGSGMETLNSPNNTNVVGEGSSSSSSISSNIAYIIVGVVAFLCLGGALVAFTIYRKQQNNDTTQCDNFLVSMQEHETNNVNDKTSSEITRV